MVQHQCLLMAGACGRHPFFDGGMHHGVWTVASLVGSAVLTRLSRLLLICHAGCCEWDNTRHPFRSRPGVLLG